MIRLAVLRHAPTAWNESGKLQGRSDPPLSPQGRALAAAWRIDPAWRNWRVIASPLQRARETASLMFPDCTIEIEPRLVEMDFGAWEGQSLADLRADPRNDTARLEAMGLDFRAPGGESPRDLQNRLQPWLGELAAARRDTVAIAHKSILRALYALASGWRMMEKPPVKFKDGHAQIFALDDANGFRLVEANRPLLREPAP